MHEDRQDESRDDAPKGPRADPPVGPSAGAAGARSGSGGHKLSAEEAARLAEELRDASDPDLDGGVVPLAPAPSSEAQALVAAPPERPPVALPERKIELGAAARPAAAGGSSEAPATAATAAARSAALAAARLPTAGPSDATSLDLVAVSRREGPRPSRARSLRVGLGAGMLAAALLAAYALWMRSDTRATPGAGEASVPEPSPAEATAPGLTDTSTSAVAPPEATAAPTEATPTAEASADTPAPAGKLAPPPKPRPASKVAPPKKPAPSAEPPPPTGTSPLPPPDSIRVF